MTPEALKAKIHEAAETIARELRASIYGSTGSSEAHQQMWATCERLKVNSSLCFSRRARNARAEWVEGLLFEML